jgi:hypothetical protein
MPDGKSAEKITLAAPPGKGKTMEWFMVCAGALANDCTSCWHSGNLTSKAFVRFDAKLSHEGVAPAPSSPATGHCVMLGTFSAIVGIKTDLNNIEMLFARASSFTKRRTMASPYASSSASKSPVVMQPPPRAMALRQEK